MSAKLFASSSYSLPVATVSNTFAAASSPPPFSRLLNSWRPYSRNQQNAAFSSSSSNSNNKATTLKLSLSSKTIWTSCRTLFALPFDLSPPPIDHDLLVIPSIPNSIFLFAQMGLFLFH